MADSFFFAFAPSAWLLAEAGLSGGVLLPDFDFGGGVASGILPRSMTCCCPICHAFVVTQYTSTPALMLMEMTPRKTGMIRAISWAWAALGPAEARCICRCWYQVEATISATRTK